jgi:hypothetical protein
MCELEKIYLYRMTHILNIPHILKNGITHVYSPNANKLYEPIGDKSLIDTRSIIKLHNSKMLGDYIPFYFGVRTPMLFVVQKGYNYATQTNPESIIYCVTSVKKIMDLKLDFIFTDGHAVNSLTSFYSKDEIPNIKTLIDWEAVQAKYWNSITDLDIKRRKEAEFLVYEDIPNEAILGYIVYNDKAKNDLITLGIDENKIIIKNQYYF